MDHGNYLLSKMAASGGIGTPLNLRLEFAHSFVGSPRQLLKLKNLGYALGIKRGAKTSRRKSSPPINMFK